MKNQVEATRKWLRNMSRLRQIMLAGGILLFIAGTFAYQIGLSESRGISFGKVLLLSTGVLIVCIGTLGRKTLVVYRNVAILFLNVIVLLIAIEAGFNIFARLRDFLPDKNPSATTNPDTEYVNDGREKLPYYAEQSWSVRYWREYHAARDVPRAYVPFLIWRGTEFKGRTLNINEDGLRLTPDSQCTEDAYTIFVFGGSTVWGTGVPDWGTIPTLLQVNFETPDDRSLCVVNYGEEGYVSTQDVLNLTLLLQAGQVPDIAIFYAGVNDVMAAYQNGQAGFHQNMSVISARFEERAVEPPLLSLVSKTRIYRTLVNTFDNADVQSPVSSSGEQYDLEAIADGVVGVYEGNYELVQALGDQYGFDFYFFWQPYMVSDSKQLTAEEASIRGIFAGVHPGVTDLAGYVTLGIEDAVDEHSNMYSFTDIFVDQTELVYIDPFHVTLEGNEIIVDKMLRLIQSEE